MRNLILAALVLVASLGAAIGQPARPAEAEEVVTRLYLVPMEVIPVGEARYCGPLYFYWGSPAAKGTGTLPKLQGADYGWADEYLVAAALDDTQRAGLLAHPDVYEFPVNLDLPVDKAAVTPFFESVNLPTDWLTAANTYRDLLRQTYGMFGFANAFFVAAGGHSLWDYATLDTRYRDLPTEAQGWFNQAVATLGGNPALINRNATMRQLLKQASDLIVRPFEFGGLSI